MNNPVRTENLRRALVNLWDARSGGRDCVVVLDGDDPDGFRNTTRTIATDRGEVVLCDADPDTWGEETPLDEYEDGWDFADMAICVFGNDLLAYTG